METLFDQSSDTHAEFYSPPEHLAVNETPVFFKGRIIFKLYIPKKHKHFGMKEFTKWLYTW